MFIQLEVTVFDVFGFSLFIWWIRKKKKYSEFLKHAIIYLFRFEHYIDNVLSSFVLKDFYSSSPLIIWLKCFVFQIQIFKLLVKL